jgi:hypothetical protein
MPRIITRINKESLTTKLTLIIIGLTAGSALLVPATYASFHPVTTSEIADETILSRDIRNGQVGSVDIGTGQVASVDIQDGTIRAADLRSGAIQITIVRGDPVVFAPRIYNDAQVDCLSGKILTGGGFFVDAAIPSFHVLINYPEDANTWTVSGFNGDTINVSLIPYALCV